MNNDAPQPEDWGLYVLAIIPDEPWQAKYGGVYTGLHADRVEAMRFALRLLTDPGFEAAENAKFLEEFGVAPPPIPEEVRPARIKRLAADLADLLARVERLRLGEGEKTSEYP